MGNKNKAMRENRGFSGNFLIRRISRWAYERSDAKKILANNERPDTPGHFRTFRCELLKRNDRNFQEGEEWKKKMKVKQFVDPPHIGNAEILIFVTLFFALVEETS